MGLIKKTLFTGIMMISSYSMYSVGFNKGYFSGQKEAYQKVEKVFEEVSKETSKTIETIVKQNLEKCKQMLKN